MDNNIVDFKNEKKHKVMKVENGFVSENYEVTEKDEVERKVFMSKVYAMIYGVSVLAIAVVNIDSARKGLPLDSIDNIIFNGGMALTGGYSLGSLIKEVKQIGSDALNRFNNNEINRNK